MVDGAVDTISIGLWLLFSLMAQIYFSHGVILLTQEWDKNSEYNSAQQKKWRKQKYRVWGWHFYRDIETEIGREIEKE